MVTPIELVKIRLQLQNKGKDNRTSHNKGPISVAKTIYRTEGIRGLYKGLSITLMRDAHAYGLYFFTYEYVREQLHPECRKTGQESLRTMLTAGGLAGVVSWLSCYPFDVLKTRLQAQSESSFLSKSKYSGIVDCFRQSVRKEGLGVLWRGLGTTVARAFVVNGAIFSGYEVALRCIYKNRSISVEKTV